MRVIVPYTQQCEAATVALEKWCTYDVEYVDVSSSNERYFEVLRDAWHDGKSFIVIEHDIEIRSDTIASLTKCKHAWCAFPYAMGPAGYETALGCTKFHTSLMKKIPHFMDEVGDFIDPWCPPRDWRRLDCRIFEVMTQRYNISQHRHEPHVHHHNPTKRVPLEIESNL